MPMTSRRVSQVLAKQLVTWRDRRGLSAEQLAGRIADLGGKLNRVAITEIETGIRLRISLDEALLLAAALNVPPPLLFFPFESGERVAVTPKSVIHPDLAYQWLTGEGWLAATDRTATGSREWSEAAFSEAALPLRLYRSLRKAQDAAHRADNRVWAAENIVKDTKEVNRAKQVLADRVADVVHVMDDMRAAAMKPPNLPKEWAAMVRKGR